MLPVEGPGRVRCRTRRRRESSRGVCPFSRVSTRSETLVVQRISLLRRFGVEISGNFPGNLPALTGKIFRKKCSPNRESLVKGKPPAYMLHVYMTCLIRKAAMRRENHFAFGCGTGRLASLNNTPAGEVQVKASTS